MAEEEAQNQEQNAEATEAVEAGAEAVEEVAVAEPKAPSVLMPMLLSALITVVGVGVMVAVILPKQISKAIASASHHDANATAHGEGEGGGEHKEGEGEHGEGEHGEGEEGEDTVATEEDDPEKVVPIVHEGSEIVINPAGSNGSRYLLVEISLLREDEKDTDFPKAVEKKTKQLQAVTVDYLSREDVQSLAKSSTKDRLKAQLKLAYQEKLGIKHPIKSLVVSKWIMQ